MRFVVLAAGVGSRLRPLTDDRPKCMVEVNGRSIIDRLLIQAEKTGRFQEAVVVTGYLPEQMEQFVNLWEGKHQLPVRIVHNAQYETTNNGYSLWCARQWLTDGFVLCDGDVVVDDIVIERIANTDQSALAIDAASRLDEEAMKFQLDASRRIVALAKTISVANGEGESIGLCHIRGEDATSVVEQLDKLVREGELQEYYERAFQELIREQGDLYVVDVGDCRWVEIDNHADLQKAKDTFATEGS